jgi:hypothetical protein
MQRINFILATTLFLSFIALTSCDNDKCITGDGGIVTREIDLDGFHSISTSGSFTITIEQSADQRVEVVSHQNIIDDLEREVTDSTWNIELSENCYRNLDITVRIYIPEIRAIESSGSIDVVLNSFDDLNSLDINCSGSEKIFQSGVLEIADRFSFNTSGSTELVANVNTKQVDITISGSGNATLQGTTESQEINIPGSGNISAFNMESDTCYVDIPGSGNLDVTVNDYLDVQISGSGNVRYMGNPTINSNITGSGALIDAN